MKEKNAVVLVEPQPIVVKKATLPSEVLFRGAVDSAHGSCDCNCGDDCACGSDS